MGTLGDIKQTDRPRLALSTAQAHEVAMSMAASRAGALAEAWLEAKAAGGSVGPLDSAIGDAVRDYRRAERKHREALEREPAA